MYHNKIQRYSFLLLINLVLFLNLLINFIFKISVSASEISENDSRIHFINVWNGDCILLESDGHFAMVDVGEDSNFPDGSDPRYPLRPGITTNEGYEEKVINYLKKCGVKKLDFIIATHAHSDHMGSMPNILDNFKVERIYAKEYKDEYISDPNGLWDNLYVYDRMIAYAKKNKVPVIQKFNKNNTNFKLGNMQVELFNYEDKLNQDGTIKVVNSENQHSIGVKITDTITERTAFLASDIENTQGDEDRLAPLIGAVDLLKLGHHGLSTSSSANFLNTLSPAIAVNSGLFQNFNGSQNLQRLANIDAELYITEYFKDAIVATFYKDDIEISNNTKMMYSPKDKSFYCYENDKMITDTWKELYWRDILCKFYFLGNGKVATGWRKNIPGYYGKSLYFDLASGVLQKGWKNDIPGFEGKWLYFNATTGVMQTGFQNIDSKTYYFDTNGVMQIGFQEISSRTYYFDDSGAMQTGIVRIDNKSYFFNQSGVLQTGWQRSNNNWYYMDEQGIIQTGWQDIDDERYYFDANGIMQTGIIKIDSKLYFLSQTGELLFGWQRSNNNWYYMDEQGIIQTGWQGNISGWSNTWFYFDLSSGIMKTGWQNQLLGWNNKWFYFDEDTGAMKTDWLYINGAWYYMNKSGVMQTGWLLNNNKWYYLDDSGAMRTGWLFNNNKWYYLDDSGAMQTGWLLNNNKCYYLSEDGFMVTGQMTINGVRYIFDSTGAIM